VTDPVVPLVSPEPNEPMPQYRLKEDYPLLYERSLDYDFAERLGGSTSKLDAEIDQAMRELWSARRALAAVSFTPDQKES
jgi:hypothetical protein